MKTAEEFIYSIAGGSSMTAIDSLKQRDTEVRREALDEAIKDIQASADKINGNMTSELSAIRGALLGIVENLTHLRDNRPEQIPK